MVQVFDRQRVEEDSRLVRRDLVHTPQLWLWSVENGCSGVRQSLASTLGNLSSVSALVSAPGKSGRLWNRPRRDTGSSWGVGLARRTTRSLREEWTLGKPPQLGLGQTSSQVCF